MSSLLFYVFVRPSEGIAAGPKSSVQQASVAAGPIKPAGISIAVLPFVNLSGDTAQEFFSDGMTEEITSALAKVSGLNVRCRSDIGISVQGREPRCAKHRANLARDACH
jgi:TolB-like protein